MADISGSSALYDDAGDADALRQVGICLDKMMAIVESEGGTFIRSKGDDVLAIFADTVAALTASRAMLALKITDQTSLAVHVGATYGNVIQARDDIFGDSVNTAARLSAMAKPGELLASDRFVERLPEHDRHRMYQLDNITFKGKDAKTGVFALLEEGTQLRTVVGKSPAVTDARKLSHPASAVTLTLRYADQAFACPERKALSIGRASDSDIVIEHPWISREHAKIQVRRGKVELTDQSTSGSFVSTQDGYEFLLKRETVLLTGSGTISPGVPATAPEAEIIRYEITFAQPIPGAADREP
jgi:hypothetical protein